MPSSKARNSKKSRKPSRQATNPNRAGGPKTPEGKAKSAANAVTHGLTAKTHLPPGAAEAFQSEHARWRRHLGLDPIEDDNSDNIDNNDDDPELALLAERVARIATTLRLARAADEAAQADRVRTARRDALAIVRDRALALAETIAQPGRAEPVVAALMDSIPGLDWLLERWRHLEHALAARGLWDADQMRLALTLIGGDAAPTAAALTRCNLMAGGAEPTPAIPPRGAGNNRDSKLRPRTPPLQPFQMTQEGREVFRELRFEQMRGVGLVAPDAVYDPVQAEREEREDQARGASLLRAEVSRRIAELESRRAELLPIHEASLDEAEVLALVVVEGRGSSLTRLRLENSLDLALHRTLKRIDLLRKEGRVAPKKPPQAPVPQSTCAKCENEPQPTPNPPPPGCDRLRQCSVCPGTESPSPTPRVHPPAAQPADSPQPRLVPTPRMKTPSPTLRVDPNIRDLSPNPGCRAPDAEESRDAYPA